MTETHYAKGITAQNLRAFLELWPLLVADIEDAKKTINECSDRLFAKGVISLAGVIYMRFLQKTL